MKSSLRAILLASVVGVLSAGCVLIVVNGQPDCPKDKGGRMEMRVEKIIKGEDGSMMMNCPMMKMGEEGECPMPGMMEHDDDDDD